MSNIALEEKIRKLSADYIYQQAVGSLLLLLMRPWRMPKKA